MKLSPLPTPNLNFRLRYWRRWWRCLPLTKLSAVHRTKTKAWKRCREERGRLIIEHGLLAADMSVCCLPPTEKKTSHFTPGHSVQTTERVIRLSCRNRRHVEPTGIAFSTTVLRKRHRSTWSNPTNVVRTEFRSSFPKSRNNASLKVYKFSISFFILDNFRETERIGFTNGGSFLRLSSYLHWHPTVYRPCSRRASL